MIVINIYNVTSEILGLTESQKDELSDKLSFEVPGSFFITTVKKGYWDGRKRYFNKRYNRFPTGLIHYVREYLEDEELTYNIVDQRNKPISNVPLKTLDLTPYFYQIEACNQAISKQRGIIKLPTGSGKTEIICMIIGHLNVKTLIVVHRIDIVNQIRERIERRLGIKIGILTGEEKQLHHTINVASVQTIIAAFKSSVVNLLSNQVVKFVKECECLIVDEAHHSSAECFQILTNRCYNAFYRYGFTATPTHSFGGIFLIEACFAKKIIEIPIRQLVEEGYLAKPCVLMIDNYYKVTKGETYQNIYKRGIVENNERNQIICDIAIRRAKRHKSVLITVQHIKHGKLLLNLIQQQFNPDLVRFMKGDVKSSERSQTLKELDEKKVLIVIATVVFSEGVDCRSLDTLINTKSQASVVDYLQVMGRAMRMTKNKKQVLIVDFFDNFRHFKWKSEDRLNVLREEKIRVFRSKCKLFNKVIV